MQEPIYYPCGELNVKTPVSKCHNSAKKIALFPFHHPSIMREIM